MILILWRFLILPLWFHLILPIWSGLILPAMIALASLKSDYLMNSIYWVYFFNTIFFATAICLLFFYAKHLFRRKLKAMAVFLIIVVLGAAMNLTVILANGGEMPAITHDEFKKEDLLNGETLGYTAATDQTHLNFLCDQLNQSNIGDNVATIGFFCYCLAAIYCLSREHFKESREFRKKRIYLLTPLKGRLRTTKLPSEDG